MIFRLFLCLSKGFGCANLVRHILGGSVGGPVVYEIVLFDYLLCSANCFVRQTSYSTSLKRFSKKKIACSLDHSVRQTERFVRQNTSFNTEISPRILFRKTTDSINHFVRPNTLFDGQLIPRTSQRTSFLERTAGSTECFV